jgi:hypothetical protein
VSPVKYELGLYIPGDAIPHSHRRENLKSYMGMQYVYRAQSSEKTYDANSGMTEMRAAILSWYHCTHTNYVSHSFSLCN